MLETIELTTEAKCREDLTKVCNFLYTKGLISGFDGNLSLRLNEKTILITGKNTHKGLINPEALVTIDTNGEILSGGLPSSDIDIHLETYRKRPDINAFIHAHPPILISLTVSGMSLDEPLIPDVIYNLGKIPLISYPGLDKEKEKSLTVSALENHNAIILSHHGSVTIGENIYKALHYTELLEFAAKITMNAKLSGEMFPLDESQLKEILNEREKSSGRNIDTESELNHYCKHKNKLSLKSLFKKFVTGNSPVFQRIMCLINELNLSVISRTSYASKLSDIEKEQLSKELTTSFFGMLFERFTNKKIV